MPWFKIRMIEKDFDRGEDKRLLENFLARYNFYQCPMDAAVFSHGEDAQGKPLEIFFSPCAASFSKDLIKMFQLEECDRPSDLELNLLVGSKRNAERLLQHTDD